MRNPFLPKKPIQWKTGPAAGTAGIPAPRADKLPPAPSLTANGYKKKNSGRKPKSSKGNEHDAKWEAICARNHRSAGHIATQWNNLLFLNTGLGASLDMLTMAHGAVGCGDFGLAHRLNLPGFIQGIDSFTALHACTDLKQEDLADKGNTRLSRAIDEAALLFPLARGMAIVNEEPIGAISTDVRGIVESKTEGTGRFIAASSFAWEATERAAQIATFKAASAHRTGTTSSRYDVALTHCWRGSGLVWIVAKLLCDIGLNPVLAHTLMGSTSFEDLAQAEGCKLIVGVSHQRDVQDKYQPNSDSQVLRQLFGTPLIWACFGGPAATDASLRAIAARFDRRIQELAETVIAANRKKVSAVIARYRPRLEGKLLLNFGGFSPDDEESFRLLGVRVGNENGWPGKTGVQRTPRLVIKWREEKTFRRYIAEAKPDLAFRYDRDPDYWRKLGLAALPYSSLFDKNINGFWGYDGFASLAAALDRHINAPWRELVKPPWPEDSG